MATYPAVLPLPSFSYSRNQLTGVRQSDLSGKARQQRIIYDNQFVYDLTFEFSSGQARLFRQWLVEELLHGRKSFTIDLQDEGGISNKLVRFTANGRPKASPQQNVLWVYTAQVVSRL